MAMISHDIYMVSHPSAGVLGNALQVKPNGGTIGPTQVSLKMGHTPEITHLMEKNYDSVWLKKT